MRFNIEKIIALNPLSIWLERYGISVDRKGYANCPFHNEKTASFKVYPNERYYCFGCGARGSVIDLVRYFENLDFNGACEFLDGDISYSKQRELEKAKKKRQKELSKKEETTANYFNALDIYLANEQIIADFKPQIPSEEPKKIWTEALNHRFILAYSLMCAESLYMRGSD